MLLATLALFVTLLAGDDRAFLGVELTADADGPRVVRVQGPAELAGVQVGDLLVALDEVGVTRPDDVRRWLAKHAPDDVVTLSLSRDGAPVTATVTLSMVRRTATDDFRTEHVLGVLDLRVGDVVADIGCGNGWLTWAASRAVGETGRVYAVEVQERKVAALASHGVDNVTAIHSAPDDVSLPAAAFDVVFLHDVASHVAKNSRETFYASITRALKPDGRMVIFGAHGEAQRSIDELAQFGFRPDPPHPFAGMTERAADKAYKDGITLRVRATASPEWRSWRGPDGSGASTDAHPPLHWSEKKNVAFRVPVPGRGHSTPIVTRDLLILTTTVPFGPEFESAPFNVPPEHDNVGVARRHRFQVIAFDRHTGETVWTTTVREAIPRAGGHATGSLASASPITDGERIVADFGSHGLFGLDLAGVVRWRRDLGEMRPKHEHGEGASPALHDGTLVLTQDHEGESFVFALDVTSGATKWKKPRNEPTSWSSPLIMEVDGRPQAIVPGTNRARAYDLESGDVTWEAGGLSHNIVATPVPADGLVILGSSYEKRAMFAVTLSGASGDVTATDAVAWFRTRATSYVPSPLVSSGAVWFLAHYQGVISRVDAATGAESGGPWRLPGIFDVYASPVAADGRVYVVSREGTTVVLSDDARAEVLATNTLDDTFNASPALIGDTLYLRGERNMYALRE